MPSLEHVKRLNILESIFAKPHFITERKIKIVINDEKKHL